MLGENHRLSFREERVSKERLKQFIDDIEAREIASLTPRHFGRGCTHFYLEIKRVQRPRMRNAISHGEWMVVPRGNLIFDKQYLFRY